VDISDHKASVLSCVKVDRYSNWDNRAKYIITSLELSVLISHASTRHVYMYVYRTITAQWLSLPSSHPYIILI
jgi:hypothetical protein